MKEIKSVTNFQGSTPAVLCSIFENPFAVHEENQGAIALAVAPQMRPRMKHIVIKYHHLQSFVANGDIGIRHIGTKEHITAIFMKQLDSELFVYL